MTTASLPVVRITNERFRLSASTIAGYFHHRCDRLFRWNTVPAALHGKKGIGWRIPAKKREYSRPGINLLMSGGNEFEAHHVRELIARHGEGRVLHNGFKPSDAGVNELEFEAVVAALQSSTVPEYIAQVKIQFSEDQEASFLRKFGLDPTRVSMGASRPDLLEVRRTDQGDMVMIRIWDFKASQAARHDHFIQVAFYSFVLEHALQANGLTNVQVDTEFAVVRSRKEEPEKFELAPYRLAVEDFLMNHASTLFDTLAYDAHYHVADHCMMCEYMDECRKQADVGGDLSRIPYISSESKRRLQREGIRSHKNLAELDDSDLIEHLRGLGHDLAVHLPRYIKCAQALEDGISRDLEGTTLLMPQYEDVRVVLSAENDPVTGTCFALGMKVFEGFDDTNVPITWEHIVISEGPGREAEILLDFLHTMNGLLERVAQENRDIASERVDQNPEVLAAEEVLQKAKDAKDEFRSRHPRITKTNPRCAELKEELAILEQRIKEAEDTVKQAKREIESDRWRRSKRLHFYVYDNLDLSILRSAIERHLFAEDPPELATEILNLLRLFPPSSILPDAETFRSMPLTVVVQVLQHMVALPVAYLYDLKSVSDAYRVTLRDGGESTFAFKYRYGFGWEHSNQVAFERIHDYWKRQEFGDGKPTLYTPEEIKKQIATTIRTKLGATDNIVRRMKQDFGDRLRLRKEPFRLYDSFDPLGFQLLDAMNVFSLLETSLDELAVKHMHTLPIEDRAAKFMAVRGMRYLPERDEPDGSLWFTFDPACRDAKIERGDFALVVTPENRPEILIGDVDGRLFDTNANWRVGSFKVVLVDYDLQSDPPCICVRPDRSTDFRTMLGTSDVFVLDKLFVDYNTHKIREVIDALRARPTEARHIHDLLSGGDIQGWGPFIDDADMVTAELKATIQAHRDGADVLNEGQWRAIRGALTVPLSLVWGPPGTGKTHTVSHLLIAYALTARRMNRPIRILVTAFTHAAIANVIEKVANLADDYVIGPDIMTIGRIDGGRAASGRPGSSSRVQAITESQMASLVEGTAPCVVVGATVWGTFKAMKETGSPIRQWFDVILIDEASQMKLPDALIAMAASAPNPTIILAGDDRQLPPIIHGIYPEEYDHMLTSVFAFVRHMVDGAELTAPGTRDRRLFQLEENFRMNEPLTAYPRHVLYGGRFTATKPDIRITLDQPLANSDAEAIDAMLDPNRPVLLCTYQAPRNFTARNPFEAELVMRLTERLSQILINPRTGSLCTPDDFAQEGLAILSPHRAQNSAVRAALEQIGFDRTTGSMPLVDTVEKLQGKERDVIFVSYGVADVEYAEAEAEFLLSSNRFNVAATRARHKLVVICSESVLSAVPTDRVVLLESMMLKEFRYYCNSGSLVLPWRSAEYGEVQLTISWRGFDLVM